MSSHGRQPAASLSRAASRGGRGLAHQRESRDCLDRRSRGAEGLRSGGCAKAAGAGRAWLCLFQAEPPLAHCVRRVSTSCPPSVEALDRTLGASLLLLEQRGPPYTRGPVVSAFFLEISIFCRDDSVSSPLFPSFSGWKAKWKLSFPPKITVGMEELRWKAKWPVNPGDGGRISKRARGSLIHIAPERAACRRTRHPARARGACG